MKRPFFTVSVQGPGGELLFRLQVPAGVAVLTTGSEVSRKPIGEVAVASKRAYQRAAEAAVDPSKGEGPGAPPGEPAAAGSASQAPTGKRRWRATPPDLLAKVERLLHEGLHSQKEIAKLTGVSQAVVSRQKRAMQDQSTPEPRPAVDVELSDELCKCGLRKPCNSCLTDENDRFTRRDPPTPL